MKRTNQKILWVCLALLVAILLNVALTLLPVSALWIDVSEHKKYSVSEETQAYLSALEAPMTLYLLNADGSDTPFEYYLERFSKYHKNMTFRKEAATDCTELLGRLGMSPESVSAYTMILVGEHREVALQYTDLFYYETDNQTLNSMGLSQMSTSEYVYYAQLFSQSEQYSNYYNLLMSETQVYFKGEASLISMIEYVSAEIIPTHYILTGHGESDLSQSLYAQIAITFGGGYRMLDLSSAASIPPDAASVLLFAPSTDYSIEEIGRLRSYVEGGGFLTVVTGQSQLALPNLMEFLGEYGLSADPSVVKQEAKVLNEEIEETTTEIVASVDVYINTDHDAMVSFDLEDAVFAVTGGNAISMDGRYDQKALMTTSEKAMLGEDTETMGKKILAASVEKETGAKLVWFTGADAFCRSVSEITEDTAPLYNAYCLYLVRDWTNLVYESELVLPDAIPYESSLLQMTGGGGMLLLSMTFLLPIGIVLGGGIVMRRRKKA